MSDKSIPTEDYSGFQNLPQEKAARILPDFKANIARMKELRARQFKLLDQLVYHVTLKASGTDHTQVRHLIYGHVYRRRRILPDGKTESYEQDAVDWKTGAVNDRYAVVRPFPTGKIVGVVLNDDRVVKFTEPCDDWR